MPIYCIDESLYKAIKNIKPIGSIIAENTLIDLIPDYVAGIDQPGYWSERQSNLFNGYGNDSGNIEKHLRKSFDLINSLMELNSEQDWYNEIHHDIAEKRIRNAEKDYVMIPLALYLYSCSQFFKSIRLNI